MKKKKQRCVDEKLSKPFSTMDNTDVHMHIITKIIQKHMVTNMIRCINFHTKACEFTTFKLFVNYQLKYIASY